MTLDELIAALEAASEGSQELDGEIYRLTVPRTELRKCLKYSASIDAALTLLPDGWVWHVDATLPSAGVDWIICHPDKYGPESRGTGATAALALCIAILKARRG